MNISEAQRIVLRLGALLVLLAVPILVVVSLFALIGPSSDDPTPVPIGQPVELPDPGLFGLTAVLYGVVPSGQDTPAEAALGCVMRDEDGGPTRPVLLSSLGAIGLDPIAEPGTGRELRPLLTMEKFASGWTLTCDGSAAIAAKPLYLNEADRHGRIIALAMLPLSVVALTLGIVGLVVLRPRRPLP